MHERKDWNNCRKFGIGLNGWMRAQVMALLIGAKRKGIMHVTADKIILSVL